MQRMMGESQDVSNVKLLGEQRDMNRNYKNRKQKQKHTDDDNYDLQKILLEFLD